MEATMSKKGLVQTQGSTIAVHSSRQDIVAAVFAVATVVLATAGGLIWHTSPGAEATKSWLIVIGTFGGISLIMSLVSAGLMLYKRKRSQVLDLDAGTVTIERNRTTVPVTEITRVYLASYQTHMPNGGKSICYRICLGGVGQRSLDSLLQYDLVEPTSTIAAQLPEGAHSDHKAAIFLEPAPVIGKRWVRAAAETIATALHVPLVDTAGGAVEVRPPTATDD
jgi:hypothetical protein